MATVERRALVGDFRGIHGHERIHTTERRVVIGGHGGGIFRTRVPHWEGPPNPYLDELFLRFGKLPNGNLLDMPNGGDLLGMLGGDPLAALARHRLPLVQKYSWAIPSCEALRALARRSPLVEIGAGTGYWAWLLRQMGADVVAYDIEPAIPQYTSVEHGTAASATHHGNRTLFLCWPPANNPMAVDAVRAHAAVGGRNLAFIGERDIASVGESCTGDDSFHEELARRYALVEEVAIPQWWGLKDALYFYRRKRRPR